MMSDPQSSQPQQPRPPRAIAGVGASDIFGIAAILLLVGGELIARFYFGLGDRR